MKPSTTILVVDDNEPTRYALSRMLTSQGYGVMEAATGAETLNQAAKKPDLIILDVRLPDLTGYEVCKRLKAQPTTASIPVLHLSATFADSESRAEGLERGADGYLTYPVEPRELIATIEALMRTRQAERVVREQSELLRVTLASIADAVIATDMQGTVTFLNPVAQTLTGWSDDAVGAPIEKVFVIVNEQTRKPLQSPGARVLGNGVTVGVSNETLLIARDGSERPIDDSAAPIRDADGNVVGAVIIFRDVTERRRVEAALRESNRNKDEFLAMLAHELRNPLAPIRNALQVLNVISSQEPMAVEARALIERQVEQLARLVDDLLDVSRITRSLIKLRKEPVEVSTVVSRAVESSRPLIDARRHLLDVTLPDGPLLVDADIVRLAQVLLNLLNNAAKYTPEGGRVFLHVERVTARGAARPEVLIRVRDTGMGIPTEMLPKVFDLFTQAERTLDRAEGGLGLGLTLVRRLTEMHGGSVTVTSPGPGQGAEFLVRLPLLDPAKVCPSRKQPVADRPKAPPRRILVVDDNRDSADSLAMLLRLLGNDARTVYDGRQALTVAHSYRPDLILLDLGLPGMSGFDVVEQLRKMPSVKDTIVMALTGYGTEEDRRQTHAAGFNAHLIKPVDLVTLEELLASPELEEVAANRQGQPGA